MTFSMAGRFALKNLRANRLFEVPFILSSGIMFILFNITSSLAGNNYVKTRHSSLPILINLIIILVGVFTFIFVLYTVGFLLKRRNREFALYGILGLEKKHIRKIISIEFFILFAIICFIAIAGGYVFGKLAFLGLNRLMKDVSGRLMDYPFSMPAMAATFVLAAALYLITILRSSFSIYLLTPVQLIGKQHSGEGEPKSRVILTFFGFIFLAAGYYIAFTAKGALSSLAYFFLAALFVMLATYLLYISFSVIILKLQKRKKSYFTPTRFLGVSGLLYRVSSNAVSLAGISILSVGVIISLSAAAAIYSNIENTVATAMPREYTIKSSVNADENNYKDEAQKLIEKVQSTVGDKSQISDAFISYNMITSGILKKDRFVEYTTDMPGIPNFLIVYDLDGYNARTRSNIKLNEDEALMCSNNTSITGIKSLTIGERTFKISDMQNIIPSVYAIDVYCMVVKDFETMLYIQSILKGLDMRTLKTENASINCSLDWNAGSISNSDYADKLKALEMETGYEVGIRSEYLSGIYELNGGFLFIGTVLGLIFITGTVLITYYKQISEGYEDKEKYQIMKKVGLDDELIKKTSSSQIVWMFFAPLLIATVHCLAASKIVYQLLGLFSIHSFMQYGVFLFSIIAAFFVIYFMIFKFTSRAYYKIVQ